MAKRKVWKGGPRSKRAYSMDYHRQSKQPWEKRRKMKGKRGVTSVTPHYRKTKRGSTKVKHHKRRYKKTRRR